MTEKEPEVDEAAEDDAAADDEDFDVPDVKTAEPEE